MTIVIRKMRCSFFVLGTPVSLQGSPSSKRQYQMEVGRAARKSAVSLIKDDDRVKLEIDWFSEGFNDKPDVDNIIKPIQDALIGIVFKDDNQVESVTSRKHDTKGVIRFQREPLCIIEPLLEGNNDYVFVRVY